MSASKSSVHRLLEDLISIPSWVSDESPENSPCEAAIVDFLENRFKTIRAEIERIEVQPGRPTLIASLPPGKPETAHYVLAPHTDTVGIGSMVIPPCTPETRDGKIYGRGACDTKGPMAAALIAFEEWAKSPQRQSSSIRWTFAALMGEENLCLGSKDLCQRGFKADGILALEPTDLKIVHAARGVLRLRASSEGIPCHSSNPSQGRNAIAGLLPFLQAASGEGATFIGSHSHPVLGNASLSLNLIRGGGAINMVPGHAEADFDIRTHPFFDTDQALTYLHGLFSRYEIEGKLCELASAPPFELATDHPFVEMLKPHANGLLTVPWCSDANVFAHHGIPAIAIGPGSITQAHTKDEFIELQALEEGVGFFKKVLGL